MLTRRDLVLSALAAALLPVHDAAALPLRGAVRRTVRRTTRRVRRRHRRRVRRRVVGGASLLVVPTALAVGWELELDGVVYVVVDIDKDPSREVVVLRAPDGTTVTETVQREDNAENGRELEGSELPANDATTPGITVEVET